MVENVITIKRHAIHPHFKMAMLRRSTSGPSHRCDRLTGLHTLTTFHEIPGIVTVTGLQAVGMTHDHHIAIGRILARKAHHTIKNSSNLVVGPSFQICPRMIFAFPTVRTDYFCSRKRITPLACTTQIQCECLSILKQAGSFFRKTPSFCTEIMLY